MEQFFDQKIDYLEEMCELGLDETFEAFIDNLRDKHSNRPAYLDELEILERNPG